MKSNALMDFLVESAINTAALTAGGITMRAVADSRGDVDKTCFFSGLAVSAVVFGVGHYVKNQLLD